METRVTYTRDGVEHTVTIETRLMPNPLAVKFVVIEHELGHFKDVINEDDPLLLDDLLQRMGIVIIDTSAAPVETGPNPKAVV